MQEIFIRRGLVNIEDCPRANSVASSSFYLPSGPFLKEEELEYVVDKIKLILDLT
jgi:dTDP-4-amino-4,6-dideoxygalactose transaminase